MAVEKNGLGNGEQEETVSYLDIERLHWGEIRGEDAVVLRRKIAASPRLQSYMERIRTDKPQRSYGDLVRLRGERSRFRDNASRPEVRNWTKAFTLLAGILRPRPAFGVAIILIAGVALWRFQIDPVKEESQPGTFLSKGRADMELLLHARGRTAEPGKSLQAGHGDTLSFSYRSDHPKYVRILYRENNGEIIPFEAANDSDAVWKPANRWTSAPRRILLEGEWDSQEIWVVESGSPLTSDEAKAIALKAGEGSGKAGAIMFRLLGKGHVAE